MFIHDAAQDFRLFEPLLGFIGFGRGPARFQVRGDEREGEICRGLNFHLGKSAADVKAPPVEQIDLVRVRMPRDNRQAAQYGDVDVGGCAADQFPKRKVRAFRPERSAEFEQRVRPAHFFEREHVWVQRTDAFADLGLGLGGFDAGTRFSRLV